MINKESHPVGWSFLIDELEDAREHLGTLITEAATDPGFGEVEFEIHLRHIFSHLSRAWHRRNVPEDLTDPEWEEASKLPRDLQPL